MTFIRLEELIDTFNDEGISNYLVAFMRLLTSKQMKKEADIYINYIDEQVDVAEFCALEVEPMFKESDFVHIHALSKVFANLSSNPSSSSILTNILFQAMNVIVRIVYLDRSVKDDISVHDFPEESSSPVIHLLYRPGHYDLLYGK